MSLQMSNAWFLWAYCVITLLVISTLFATITLVCRYRTKTLWFYKTKTFSSANRSLILPNITVVFSTLSIAFNAFSIPHDIAMIMAYKHVERANDVYQRLYSFVLPLSRLSFCQQSSGFDHDLVVCGLITELHGIAILLYLSRPKIPTFFGIKILPLAINLFFMYVKGSFLVTELNRLRQYAISRSYHHHLCRFYAHEQLSQRGS